MKIGVVADEEIGIARFVSGTDRFKNVAGYFVEVEARSEQIVLILLSKGTRLVAYQPGGRRRTKVRHHRHHFTRARMFVDDVMNLPIHAPVDRVNQTVALAIRRILQKRAGKNTLALGREGQSNGIVHTARHDWFN